MGRGCGTQEPELEEAPQGFGGVKAKVNSSFRTVPVPSSCSCAGGDPAPRLISASVLVYHLAATSRGHCIPGPVLGSV